MADNPWKFNPRDTEEFSDSKQLDRSKVAGDERTGRIYVYHRDEIKLAVNVALATARPLLLSGPSGCGKSSLAMNVALCLGWRYYELVVTGQTEAQHLLWKEDTLRRLRDVQMPDRAVGRDMEYLEAGPLWWCFDRGSAKRECSGKDPSKTQSESDGAVLLIDEIDKADPDVPNDLLVPLGSLEFAGPVGSVIGKTRPLILITTNRERELPTAFIRRCLVLELPAPSMKVLIKIATAHLGLGSDQEPLLLEIAEKLEESSRGRDGEVRVNTAEFLDTVEACLSLGIGPGDKRFEALRSLTLGKQSLRREQPWAL